LPCAVADETQVRFVDKGSGVERLPRCFVRELTRGQSPQFVIN
jgi:hypothetical protein